MTVLRDFKVTVSSILDDTEAVQNKSNKHLVMWNMLSFFWLKKLTVSSFTPDVMDHLRPRLDGVRAEGSEWIAEEREGRLEPVDSGTESADDGYVTPHTSKWHPAAY